MRGPGEERVGLVGRGEGGRCGQAGARGDTASGPLSWQGESGFYVR